MAKNNILEVILRTIEEVKNKNQSNPQEETAHPNVFDLLKNKIGGLDQKIQDKRIEKGKNPVSILDLIRNQVEAARNQNRQDPNTPNAPDSIFNDIQNKINESHQNRVYDDVQRIAREYNLDISRLPENVIKQIETKYDSEARKFDQQFAQAIHNMLTQQRQYA